ncbi:Carbonic anhydrase [Orchesella cincta]|uniref:carbonic anhydrase n=1 Tax=Orchesella cincta TaxID=48709 RepID=A0A1D2MM90_ORCCI|nr:Carbonic anhydrase [Orchesella cincta]
MCQSSCLQFCYKDAEGCGPHTSAWGGACQTGKRQSPINLPLVGSLSSPTIKLNLENYKANSFRLQNNGHSIAVDFVGQGGPSAAPRNFPDPINRQISRDYVFSGAHFHWGPSNLNGSEHCIAGVCAQMELHLVHYGAQYESQADAVASGNQALAVVGVLLAKSGMTSMLTATGVKSDALAPIVRNLHKVEEPDHTKFETIKEPLDFTSLLRDTGIIRLPAQVYTYKGSLTTPGCNEQVNWYVMRRPALTSYTDVENFRDSPKTEEGQHLEDNHRPLQPLNGREVKLSVVFCYNDEEGCGPRTSAWGGACQTGTRQSPINLPLVGSLSSPTIKLNLNNYKADSFRLQNNGHSIAVDFVGQGGPSAAPRAFPDPIDHSIVRDYVFSGAHFHWGPSNVNGSEHCIAGVCGQMELHLVHYQAKYNSQADAVASGDPEALAVMGVVIHKSGIVSVLTKTGVKSDALAPIVRNLHQVEEPDHHSFVIVNEPLDFTSLLKDTGLVRLPAQVYTYKGSLTTPGCNEQVNWYVLRRPALTTNADVENFRDTPKTEEGKHLEDNHRPLQPLNGREVKLSVVV